MSARTVLYLTWAVILLGVGILDIEMAFEPLGTFLVVVLTGIAVFYRRIIATYVRLNIPREFVVTTLGIAAVNVIAGLSLNSVVDTKAKDLVTRIERYRQKNGYFPTSLANVADDQDLHRLKRNHLIFGAAVVYTSDGKIFYFSYSRYLVGDSVWNENKHEFQHPLD